MFKEKKRKKEGSKKRERKGVGRKLSFFGITNSLCFCSLLPIPTLKILYDLFKKYYMYPQSLCGQGVHSVLQWV